MIAEESSCFYLFQYYSETLYNNSLINIQYFIQLLPSTFRNRRAIKNAVFVNRKLYQILSELGVREVDEETLRIVRDILGRIKEMKLKFQSEGLNNHTLDDLVDVNIRLSYKIEKEVRKSLYAEHRGALSELAKSASSISSQNIGLNLYAH